MFGARPADDRARPPLPLLGLIAAVTALSCQHRAGGPTGADAAGQAGDARLEGACTAIPGEPPLGPSEPQRASGVPCLRFDVEVGDAPQRGPADAPVTIVMFSDFECPFCRQGYETVRALEREYAGRVRFVYKAFPIDRHPNALVAAMIAKTAQRRGRFWAFHDLLYSQRGIDPQTLRTYVQDVGLDVSEVQGDLDSLVHAPSVRRDMRQARRLGVESTPTFYVNGRPLRGALPIEVFRLVIDEELGFAAQLETRGVDGGAVYERLTGRGYGELVYANRAARLDESKLYAVPIGSSLTRGPADAPITIVAFGDLQCPYCARGHATVQAMERAFAGQIRVVHKHFPLPGHTQARPAARAVMAAQEQGRAWEFLDAIYELEGRVDPTQIEAIAQRLGLDMKRFADDWMSTKYDAEIDADLRLGIELGIRGTPAYFINGRPLDGARAEIDFRMSIVEERERADRARARGIPPAKLYEHLIAHEE